MGSKNKKKKNNNNENNNHHLGVVKDNPMKKTTEASIIQTLPHCESKKLDSLSITQDPQTMTDSEKLFEKVKAKVEALKAARNIPSHDTSVSTPEKTYPLEKTIENGQQACLGNLPNVSQIAEVTADADPLVQNSVNKSEDIKGPESMSSFGSDSKISKSENENINFVKQKKKKMKKKKKKKTTDIKMQTHLEQSASISPIVVGSCPTNLDPIQEFFVQELPKYEGPEPVSNFGSDPKLFKFENEKISVVQQKKKKMNKRKKNKATDIKIQTLIKQSENISPIVGCCPTCFHPLKESLVHKVQEYENTKFESLSQKQEPVSEKDLEKSLEQNMKLESLSQKQDPILNKDLEKSLEQNTKLEFLSQKQDPISNKVLKKSLEQNTKLESLSQKQDPITNKDLEKSLEQNTKPESLSQKQDPISNKDLESSLELNAKLESLSQKQDPMSNKDLEKSLGQVKEKTKALKANGNTSFRNIPFYDKSASTPDKAYPLEKIIEKEEWDCLGDLLNFPPGAKLTPDAYPIFVCNRVQKLEDIKDESEKRTVAGVLQYITHLIKYKDHHSHECKPGKSHKFPSIIEEKFRTIFNEPSSRSLWLKNRKLLISYVLVLTLFVDGYQSDTFDIAKDLRLNIVELKKQYERLGCKIVDDESVLLVTLPAPLESPILNNRSKKRKR
ncbi:uncharacterized protein LOC141724755 isoform X2 [Apium graveolens]|uniref:uncharacterized protein LOC141724755 isoform X2 n=1 Tax=Apium graveolens TaxID=4045 RepID=UPI003D7B77EE